MKGMGITTGLVLAASVLGSLTMAHAADLPQRVNYGHQEHVRVVDATPIEVIAVLDPAAPYSVLNAVGIKYFNRDTKVWARFTIDNGSVLPGSRITLERQVLTDNKVQQQNGGIVHQPRVSIELCLGVEDFKTEVRLVERNGYTPPLQLGRDDLAHLGTVDAQRKFTQEPRCVPPQTQTETLPKSAVAVPVANSVSSSAAAPAPAAQLAAPVAVAASAISAKQGFNCDGRTYCSQMTSCAEAKFFLNNCPNVEMDGNHDGIPCEKQWCH